MKKLTLRASLSPKQIERLAFEIPEWMNLFKTELETERDPNVRQEWESDTPYLMAACFSAVGIGNFWRFPILTYYYGGAVFFIPYLTCLVFLGIPLVIMELALGQKIQRASNIVFRSINKHLAGIGFIAAVASFITACYYNVLVA